MKEIVKKTGRRLKAQIRRRWEGLAVDEKLVKLEGREESERGEVKRIRRGIYE